MKDKLLLIYNAHLVDKNLDIKKGAVLINGKKIEGFPSAETVKKMLSDENVSKYDAKGNTVLPAFIDMHAHFRDPGLTYKEDIESGSLAAAAGGFSTLVLMPNTKPVISSLEQVKVNNEKAKKTGRIKVFQSASITKDFEGKDVSHLEKLNSKVVPVITEDGKEVTNSDVMLEGMKIAAKKNIIVSCHCEDPFLASYAKTFRTKALELLNQKTPDKKKAKENLKQADKILALAEDCASSRNILLAEQAGCHLHLCHVSTSNVVEMVRQAKKKGLNVTCEITPHHIGLTSDGDGVLNIVNPPLKSEAERKALIQALKDGTADVIATDHAPHSDEDKKNGAPGFSGLETAFGVCYTTLVKENNFSLKELSALMSANPAKLLNLSDEGTLEEGKLANLVVVDLDNAWKVYGEEFASRGKFTPLEGKSIYGKVLATFFEGNIVFQD